MKQLWEVGIRMIDFSGGDGWDVWEKQLMMTKLQRNPGNSTNTSRQIVLQ